MSTGRRIATLRESQGILQKELARAINIDPVVLNRIEKGKRPVRGEELKAIADYFNVTTDYLLGRNEQASSALSDEEKNLLTYFNVLDKTGRNTLLTLLNSLAITHSLPEFGRTSAV